MKKSLIILAGGLGKRVNFYFKPLLKICDKTLIEYLLERLSVPREFDETIIVVKSVSQKAKIEGLVRRFNVKIVVDSKDFKDGPLVAMYTGAKYVSSDTVAVLATDYPLMTIDVINKLINKLSECDASIPKWPSGYIEPLVSAYWSKKLLKASQYALFKGLRRARALLSFLEKPCFINVYCLASEPEKVFLNVNTFRDLKLARKLLRSECSDRGS